MATLQQTIAPELKAYFEVTKVYDDNYTDHRKSINNIEFQPEASPFKMGATVFAQNADDLFSNEHFKKALETTPLTPEQQNYLAHTFFKSSFATTSIHSLLTHIAGNMFPTTEFEFSQYDGKETDKSFVIDSKSNLNAEEPYDITVLLQEQIKLLADIPKPDTSNISQINKFTCAQFVADVHLAMLDASALSPYDNDYEGDDDENYDIAYTQNAKQTYQDMRNLFATNLQATKKLVDVASKYDATFII